MTYSKKHFLPSFQTSFCGFSLVVLSILSHKVTHLCSHAFFSYPLFIVFLLPISVTWRRGGCKRWNRLPQNCLGRGTTHTHTHTNLKTKLIRKAKQQNSSETSIQGCYWNSGLLSTPTAILGCSLGSALWGQRGKSPVWHYVAWLCGQNVVVAAAQKGAPASISPHLRMQTSINIMQPGREFSSPGSLFSGTSACWEAWLGL